MSKKVVDTSGLDHNFIIGQTDRSNREAKPVPAITPAATEEAVPPPVEPVVSVAVPTSPIADAPREESRRRRPKAELPGFESLFLNEVSISARSGKTVYICKEHHDRILKILHVIAKNEVSLFSYLFNVLEHHFNNYQDEITELYDTNHEKPF